MVADILAKSAAEVVGYIILAVRKRARAAETVHNGASFALDATFDLVAVDRAFALFEPFAREKRFGTSSSDGSGLGMAITKRYVEMMGGSILVSSEKDKGTTFVVGIPMKVTKVPKQAILGEAEKFSLEGVHVLLAEDNDLNAEIAMLQLEKQGMVVKRVENGQEAVETFADQPAGSFDVILMDIMMPLMNGYEATKAIRSMESRPDAAKIPIIAMTANAFAEDVEAAHAAGMDAHLSKPIDMEEVLQTLRRCLQNQK